MPSPLLFFYTAPLPCTLSSLASHRHKQANYLRFLCDARCDDKFCVTQRADVRKKAPPLAGELAIRREADCLRGNTSRHLVASSYSPFDCSLHSQPLSPFHGDSFWLAVARQLHSSTQKFIVEAASEKKVRHLACFDDSDASDDSVQGH